MMRQNKSKCDHLILSVDDIGLCRENDNAIEAQINPAMLDRVSVMTGFGGLEHMAGWLDQVPALDLHLNLTEFKSRSGNAHSPARVETTARRARFALRTVFGLYSPARVQDIWRAQIEAFHARFGRLPDGLNSHEHIHLFAPYFKRAVALAQDYQIGHIRLGKKSWAIKHDYRSKIITRFHAANIRSLERASCSTSQAIYSYDAGAIEPERLIAVLPERTEVIFHPDKAGDKQALEYLVQKR